MKFTIETLNDNGSGMRYSTKEAFLKKISLMIDDCIANGGTYFDAQIDSDASCFLVEEDEEDEDNQLDCDGECVGCDRACADRIPDIEGEEEPEEDNCAAGTYDCDTCPINGDCIRQNEEG